MKAFFHRLHIGGGGAKDKDPPSKEKLSLPPLPSWPPHSQTPPSPIPQHLAFKPLPELDASPSLAVDRPLPPIQDLETTPTPTTAHSTESSSPEIELPSVQRKPQPSTSSTVASDVPKKVAFIAPTNGSTRTPPETAPVESPSPNMSQAPVKSTVSRFHAAHTGVKEPRGSTSTATASSSKTDVVVTNKQPAVKATSVRAVSPYAQSAQSLRSQTPYSHMSSTNSGSRILAAASWSEVTEGDLVSNLGSRERTRQEVLFEIISSEERYVTELVKMKDSFVDPLLHPYSSTTVTPISSTPNLDYDIYRSDSPVGAVSADYLPPIAARFMSPTPSAHSEHPSMTRSQQAEPESYDTDDEDELNDGLGKSYDSRRAGVSKHNHPRSPYRATAMKSTKSGGPVPFPSRSHHSLPPPPRANLNESTQSLGDSNGRERSTSQGKSKLPHSSQPSKASGMLRKFKKSETSPGAVLGDAVAPHMLPEDLRICLEVVDSGIFDGHKRLHEALRKRYDEQYPLVRSLADVFVSNSDIFIGYAKYVLHLERALEQVHEALTSDLKKNKAKADSADYIKVCKLLQRLETEAVEKGETGLAITLSKPFQRLLKYPLLFQNLLFHTDPSTYEYESTLQMVAEIEAIVRSIQDEKIQKEDRDKTRDAFARIEGLEKVKQLALPKPSRVLVEERLYVDPTLTGNATPPPKGVKGKSSIKRLSDVLAPNSTGIGGKKDLWLVIFNDVVLQCQRTGTTTVPLVAVTSSRVNSLPDMQGKAKYATMGRRNPQTKPRNLYKFIKIETWAIGDVVGPREGVVSMEDVVRTRSQVHQPKIIPMPDDDEEREMDSDDSDRKSKMSFSYWGADKITVQKPATVKTRPGASASRRGGPSYARESSANAKFGSRLVSADLAPSHRPVSRRTQATPSIRYRATTEESVRATVTRQGPTRSPSTSTHTTPVKRIRNTSQNSGPALSTRTPISPSASASVKSFGSPAPSEDSGVGLYRQMLAKDPTLNTP